MSPQIPDLSTCKKLGFIVPSSNTAVEPITHAVLQTYNSNIICIFTRIPVATVGLDAKSTSQFSTETMVNAARLLADAKPDAILWNGTSGQWTGGSLEDDRELARAMQKTTGVPCSTNTIASVEALNYLKVKKVSIAVPYAEAHTAAVGKFFDGCGFETVKATTLEVTPPSNADIAASGYDDIKEVVRRSKTPDTEAILVSCTNWPATGLVEELEDELGVPVLDSISLTAWWAVRMAGIEEKVSGWGRLLAS